MTIFKDLYKYRELLKTNTKKEIRGKYKASALGVLWSFINPLLQVLVYAIVFPFIMRGAGTDNYVVYLITGIIPWTFFTNVVSWGTPCIKYNAGIIKKVYFPREILPISLCLSALINFGISCIIILIFCIIFGVGITPYVLLVPVVAIVQTILSLGIIFILSALNVYVQDIEHIIGFVLQMAFYGTPIIYDLKAYVGTSHATLMKLIILNPLTTIINSYRDLFLYHTMPNWTNLGIVFVLGLIVLVLGYKIFKKLEKGFAEEL